MFNHVNVGELPTVTTETIDRKRFYVTPEGNKYPSITTVLGVRKNKELFEWRQKVGEEVAGYIARTAAQKGTKVHHMCEDYLNNDFDEEKHKKNFFPYCLFTQLKSVLKNVDNIHFQEAGLYSDKYGIAGRVDCIAEYNGKLSIIDFKTSRKFKKREWIKSYFMQTAGYAVMFEERTGIPVSQLVILMAVDGDQPLVFVEKRDDHIHDLIEVINEHSSHSN